MTHIDRGYLSVRENFRQLWVKREKLKELWRWTNPFKKHPFVLPFYRTNLDPKPGFVTQLKGSFQPIVDAAYDAADTFRANKSWKDVARDLLQPVRGLGNFLEGLGQLVYIPLYMVAKLTIMNIWFAVKAEKGDKLNKVLNNTAKAFTYPASWLINSAAKLLRGITQVVTTPLSWLKIIARGFSTLENRGVQRLVDDRSVKKLLERAEKLAGAQIDNPLPNAEQPLLNQNSNNKNTIEAINRALELKFKKEVQRLTGKVLSGSAGMNDERANNGAVQENAQNPKRLHFIGIQNPSDGNYVKFFKDARVARKAELDAISVQRFGRFSRAAKAA